MKDISEIDLHCSKKGLFVFLIPSGLMLLLSILLLIYTQQIEVLKLVVMAMCMFVICTATVMKYNIRVHNGKLTYTALFKGSKSVRISEIAKYKVVVGCYKYVDRSKPTVRAEISTFGNKIEPLCINAKVFNAEELKSLFDFLDNKIQENNLRKKGD